MLKSKKEINKIFKILESSYSFIPLINKLSKEDKNPFRVLVSIILSARTKDETTEQITEKLFSIVKSPQDVIDMDIKELEKLIYKSGFYKVKAKNIKKSSSLINNKYKGIIPSTMEDLIKLPGVGLKTASLYLIEIENKHEICVDTHVHRISNRLELIKTKSANESYYALKQNIDKKWWKSINRLMVSFGKTICKSRNPNCKICKLQNHCTFYLLKEFKK